MAKWDCTLSSADLKFAFIFFFHAIKVWKLKLVEKIFAPDSVLDFLFHYSFILTASVIILLRVLVKYIFSLEC